MKQSASEKEKSRLVIMEDGRQIYVDVTYKKQNRWQDLEYNYNRNSFSNEAYIREEVDDAVDRIKMIKICKRELLKKVNGVSFGKYFKKELDELFVDEHFIEQIDIIRNQGKEIELSENYKNPQFLAFKKTIIPNLMYELKIDENPAFNHICNKTAEAGLTKLSAKITVYYLIRILQITEPYLEEKSVIGLANAIKKLGIKD